MHKIPITRRGHQCLMKELARLRRVERPAVLEELQEARSFGARHENQQYLLARERHLVLQRRITDLEEKLHHCEIVVGRRFLLKQVSFGTVVVILNLDTGETHQYQMVGPYESDVSNGRLSVESPVGRCLMGSFEGEEVTVLTPAGIRMYRVLSVLA